MDERFFYQCTKDLLASYEEIGGINHRSVQNLPSKEAVQKIVTQLETLAFPGYRREDGIDHTNKEFVIGELVMETARMLIHEIVKSLEYEARINSERGCPASCYMTAREKTETFFSRMPAIRSMLMKDVEAAWAGDPAAKSVEEVILAYPGVDAITVHRFAHELWTLEVPLIPRMMNETVHARTGIDIHPGAEIGERFFIDHGTGVVIGETTVIGKNVKLYQGVTLGALSVKKEFSSKKRHPTIEDNVTIYSGATILGGETVIGSGSTIGGNVWITSSVPAGTVMYLPPVEYVIECKCPDKTKA
jgi:serine O-acetyltransferase